MIGNEDRREVWRNDERLWKWYEDSGIKRFKDLLRIVIKKEGGRKMMSKLMMKKKKEKNINVEKNRNCGGG